MHRGKRVVGFIPWGRQQTASMLVPYLIREHLAGVLDEVMICMNVDRDTSGGFDHRQWSDIDYAHSLVSKYPSLFRIYLCPGPDTPELKGQVPDEWFGGYRNPKQMNTMRFYHYMQDRNTMYLRFDDDIVWIHRDAIKNMVDFKLDNPGYLAVFPTIWNNAISSYCLQQWGHLDTKLGIVQPNAVDPVGWGYPLFAEYVHNVLLHHLDHDHEDACLTDKIYELGHRQQFSVSSFCISGDEYADVKGVLTWDEEEHWLTQHYTGEVNRCNVVYGMSQVSHLTFFTQREFIWKNTGIPHRYWAHSENVVQKLPKEWQWR